MNQRPKRPSSRRAQNRRRGPCPRPAPRNLAERESRGPVPMARPKSKKRFASKQDRRRARARAKENERTSPARPRIEAGPLSPTTGGRLRAVALALEQRGSGTGSTLRSSGRRRSAARQRAEGTRPRTTWDPRGRNFFANNPGSQQGRGGYAPEGRPDRGGGKGRGPFGANPRVNHVVLGRRSSNPTRIRRPGPHQAGPPRGRKVQTNPGGSVLRELPHIASVETLARAALEIATRVEREVLRDHKRADRMLGAELRPRRDLAPTDHRFISQCAFALLRWGGWLEPLGLEQPEEPPALCLAARFAHPPSRLPSLGTQPSPRPGPARPFGRCAKLGRAFRRIQAAAGRAARHRGPLAALPPWLRENLPLPPGGGSPKTRFVELLAALQRPPSLWVRVQGADEAAIWSELTAGGIKPWIHRRLTVAAKLDPDSDVHHLPAFTRGELEIQDLASQAVGMACDPDPGERWWDACAGAGGKSLHLASLMKGKGLVVATDVNAARLKEAVRRARRSPFRNLTTKPWDGRHVPGKPKSFDGVLVDAPCSAIGTWRRNPDARWSIDRHAIARLAETQAQLLHVASAAVKPGGTLVYSVCTLTPAETTEVVRNFLQSHPQFQLDPFPHPLLETSTDGTVLIWPQDSDTDAMFIRA